MSPGIQPFYAAPESLHVEVYDATGAADHGPLHGGQFAREVRGKFALDRLCTQA